MSGEAVSYGEVNGARQIRDIPCETPGVTAREGVRKVGPITVRERIYDFPHGLSLWLRSGGPLHLAREGEWEASVRRGLVRRGPVYGWLPDALIEEMVRRVSLADEATAVSL